MAIKPDSLLLIYLFLVIFFVDIACSDSPQPPPPPPPIADCTTLVLELADCLSYVYSGSIDKKPQGSCCSGIKTVLSTNAQCLCFGFRNSAQFGIGLNLTRAMTLPDVCRLPHQPLSNCDALPPVKSQGPTTSVDAAAPSPISGANEVNPTQVSPGGGGGEGGSSGSSILSFSSTSGCLLIILTGILIDLLQSSLLL